ncbi:MAG TPA: hypothetical protein VFJ74_05305 [Gemmatimonadaceae bacterium]|nr:hypothetical protein [Gemmatimonadaceae bacterium]
MSDAPTRWGDAPRPLVASSDGGAAGAAAATCRGCATQVALSLLACPGCGTLVHADELTRLAARAAEADDAGDLRSATAAWREALTLLPDGAPQRAAVNARIDDLARRAAAGDASPRPASSAPAPPVRERSWLARGWGAIVGAVVVVLSKAKLLLLGLTKAGTLFSMLGFLGVYWRMYGWGLAAGIVVSIYLHEMGHVFALARYGVTADSPMFIPGLGAYVSHKRGALRNAHEIAVVGLAGPLWGLGAAAASYALWLATGNGAWRAIAALGALINLLNLIPVWQLDGARGFGALSRTERWSVAAVAAVAALAFSQRAGFAVALVGAYQAYMLKDAPAAGDRRAFAYFAALVVLLTGTMALAS